MSTRIVSSQRSAILDDSRCENQARYEGVAEAGEAMSTRIVSQRSALLDDPRCENQARYEKVAEMSRRRYVD